MNVFANGWRLDAWMDEGNDGCMNQWMNGLDEWKEGWIDGWMNGWIYG